MVAVFGIFDNLGRWEAGFSATSDADSRQFMKLSGDISGEIHASGTIFRCKPLETSGLSRLTLYTLSETGVRIAVANGLFAAFTRFTSRG